MNWGCECCESGGSFGGSFGDNRGGDCGGDWVVQLFPDPSV